MKVGFLIALVLSLLLGSFLLNQQSEHFAQFQQWKIQHRVHFQNQAEEFYRRTIFYRNLREINRHNGDASKTYEAGINQFTIYTQEEFVQRFLNTYAQVSSTQEDTKIELNGPTVDWTQAGAVGPVENQGSSGAAGLYATIGGVQGLSFVTKGARSTFSRKQLKDCAYSSGGALSDAGYKYYKSNSVCTDSEYDRAPNCRKQDCQFKISGYITLSSCENLASQLLKQPISVVVDASSWSAYRSGVFNNCKTNLNHMVLLTGLNDEFWTCKNSWGTSWGQKGYIRLARGNTCGICLAAIYPTK